MLQVGDIAPNFKAAASNDQTIELCEFRGKKVVLYFYSKDMTSGCTAEANDFSHYQSDFSAAGAVVIGVSKDPITSHHKFIAKYALPFLLVSDPELAVIRAYDVYKEKNMYGKKTMGVERTTFIIDEQGVIVKVYKKVRVNGHVAQVLADIQTLFAPMS
ncbi:MAG: peroxiredoxin [Peptococcaceae bacterium]|nr:peroxiredoxin [Peptococcaceae bacterium]